MDVVTTFSDSELRTLQRAFCVRKATPEEVCLVVRPRRRSMHLALMGIATALLLGAAMHFSGLKAYDLDSAVGGLLVPSFWWACVLVACLDILVFFLVPGAYAPRFELVLRPGGRDITMRGLGFQQHRLASCCSVANRYLWCNFYVDTIRYTLARRWWQTLIPITRAAHVAARALAPATTALRELVLGGGGHAEMLLSTERMLWARTFGEAFVTEDEVVVMLVPQGWWAWFASLILIFGGSAAIFWPMAICPPAYCYYATRDAVTCSVSKIPMWLPAALVILAVALICIWVDPWFRRAVAVIPKGQRRIRIQVGKRSLGEFPFFGDLTIWVSDGRGSDMVSSYLWIRTPVWKGTTGVGSRYEEAVVAVAQLQRWAGLDFAPEGDSHG
jgi:hypothetical protein